MPRNAGGGVHWLKRTALEGINMKWGTWLSNALRCAEFGCWNVSETVGTVGRFMRQAMAAMDGDKRVLRRAGHTVAFVYGSGLIAVDCGLLYLHNDACLYRKATRPLYFYDARSNVAAPRLTESTLQFTP